MNITQGHRETHSQSLTGGFPEDSERTSSVPPPLPNGGYPGPRISSVPPVAFEVAASPDGLAPTAALILIAGVAALVLPMLMGNVPDPDARSSANAQPAPVYEQFIQLDEVVILGSDDASGDAE